METEDSDIKTKNSLSSVWRGTSIADICKNKGPWSFAVTPVVPSKYHCILYKMPVMLQGPPEPYYITQLNLWDDDHVRMPYSEKNLFPVCENGTDVIKQRWTIINEVLSKPISSSYEFEEALNKYNSSLPKFEALHYFCNEALESDESKLFFLKILPNIIKLALRLPQLLPSGIPLLRQNHNRSLSLSQLQIACILANAFLCTFPWRKTVAASYPGVNFVGLFSSFARPKRKDCMCEKLKCLCNYFRRVTENSPKGVVTFERKFIPRSSIPRWDSATNNLGDTRIHITSSGTIEDDGLGFLQVDFANKNVGGGVLRYGCVQEEIRFMICPELIVSRLFVEQLGHTEAVIITGAERYNNYIGYGDSFGWESNCEDETPYDVYGRRRTTICVIDATKFSKSKEQFLSGSILRELNKAYVGFSSREKENLAPVATGNWGCGAFNGSKQLKTLLQLMACSLAKRDLVYYSFGDEELMENFYQMHLFLANNEITVAQLWKFLGLFTRASLHEDKLFSFIQQAYFDSKKQPKISRFFNRFNESTKEKLLPSTPSTSYQNKNMSATTSKGATSPKRTKMDEVMDFIEEQSPSSEEIIPSSQPEETSLKNILKIKQKKTSKDILKKLPKTDICQIFDMLDGNANQANSNTKNAENDPEENVLSIFDIFTTNKISKAPVEEKIISLNNEEKDQTVLEEVIVDREEKMEVDDGVIQSSHKESQKKISDYFIRPNK